ncbi:MAG: ribonuclease P protein component [bacterium]|nr:ribonuclease P protein component [bacterium]
MLPRQQRLPLQKPFVPEFQKRTDAFIVKARHNDFAINRYAFIVGKRIDKRAVVRNSTKRAYRQCVEELKPSSKGYDMLFIVRKPCGRGQKEELCKMIQTTIAAGDQR